MGASPRLANLGNDPNEFISEEHISIQMRSFRKSKNKVTRAYTQSGQYHTIVKTRDQMENLGDTDKQKGKETTMANLPNPPESIFTKKN